MGAEETLIAASIVSALAGLLAVMVWAASVFKRTIGRRRASARRVERLGTGAGMSFFEAVLQGPPAIRRTIVNERFVEIIGPEDPRWADADGDEELNSAEMTTTKTFTECFFVDRDFYVQTICDSDDVVLAFCVASRHPRFRPTFEVPHRRGFIEKLRERQRWGVSFKPLLKVRLGRTRFADLDPDDPDEFSGPHFEVSLGAHNFSYAEYHSHGNPGYYQTYVVAASDVTYAAPMGAMYEVAEEIGGRPEWPFKDEGSSRFDISFYDEDFDEPEWENMPAAQQFRRESVITIFAAIAPELWERNYPASRFGPHPEDVRRIP